MTIFNIAIRTVIVKLYDANLQVCVATSSAYACFVLPLCLASKTINLTLYMFLWFFPYISNLHTSLQAFLENPLGSLLFFFYFICYISNYLFFRENVKTGVKSGFVRAKIDCRSGLDAFKANHKLIASRRSPPAVLDEWYASNYLRSDMVHRMLTKQVKDAWSAETGKTVNESLKDALVAGVGQPIMKLINYLEFNHSLHCLPNDLSSGLGNLPVSHVYVNGTPGN